MKIAMEKITIKNIFDSILNFLFPEPVEFEFEGDFNLESITSLALPKIFNEPIPTYALFHYENTEVIKKLIWKAKYRNSRASAEIIARCVIELLEAKKYWGDEKPILIPVPSTKDREKREGYNQCFRITKALEEIDLGEHFSVRTDLLIKNRVTLHQAETKSRKERIENLKGCFTASPVHGNEIHRIEEKISEKIFWQNTPLIIFDDIITTGTTLKECAIALKKAGWKNIRALTVAYQPIV